MKNNLIFIFSFLLLISTSNTVFGYGNYLRGEGELLRDEYDNPSIPSDLGELIARLNCKMEGVGGLLEKHNTVGAVVVFVQNGQIYGKGFGYANSEEQTEISPDKTVFVVASNSKLVTAWGIVKLANNNNNNIDLDSPVDKVKAQEKIRFLSKGYEIVNDDTQLLQSWRFSETAPFFTNETEAYNFVKVVNSITLRKLIAHRSFVLGSADTFFQNTNLLHDSDDTNDYNGIPTIAECLNGFLRLLTPPIGYAYKAEIRTLAGLEDHIDDEWDRNYFQDGIKWEKDSNGVWWYEDAEDENEYPLWSYSNNNYSLLTQIVEDVVSDKTFVTYMQEIMTQDLGMNNSIFRFKRGFWTERGLRLAQGYTEPGKPCDPILDAGKGFASLYTTGADYANFAKAMMVEDPPESGNYRIQKIITPPDKYYIVLGENGYKDGSLSREDLFEIEEFKQDINYDDGSDTVKAYAGFYQYCGARRGYSSHVVMNPANGDAIIIHNNTMNYVNNTGPALNYEIVDAWIAMQINNMDCNADLVECICPNPQ